MKVSEVRKAAVKELAIRPARKTPLMFKTIRLRAWSDTRTFAYVDVTSTYWNSLWIDI